MQRSNSVYVQESKIPGAGRGVFARGDIQAGEVIEVCPFIEIPDYDKESCLVTYLFFYGKKNTHACLVLGFGSLYNHSYTPNAMYKLHDREKTVEFIAKTTITKDFEITFDYSNGNRNVSMPLWFEV